MNFQLVADMMLGLRHELRAAKSSKVTLREVGNATLLEIGVWRNNRAEDPHRPLRRREKVMNRSKSMRGPYTFADVQSAIRN